MKTLVLTGMSGAGKSSIGNILAKEINSKLIDIDHEIEISENLNIAQIFDQKGENYFRCVEAELIKNFFRDSNLVISLGGGAFENKETRDFLLKNSIVIYLKTSPEIIFNRLKNTNNRPLLNKNMSVERIQKMINSRSKNYELAHFTVLTDNKDTKTIVSEILKCVNSM